MTLELRKLFTVAVNVQGFVFLFGTWIFLLVLAYWTYFWEEYEYDSEQSKAWYKIFMAQMLAGAITLQVQSSVRYWYWDYYYANMPD